MFKTTKDNFYQSLSESIEYRKKALGLKRNKILNDERRVSKIVHAVRNKHYPYLICRSEYPRLNLLFSCESQKSYEDKNDLNAKTEELIKKYGNNYDEMLWGHIDWDKMFHDVIAELSELDILEHPEKLKELEKLKESKEVKKQKEIEKCFKDTLVDYVPYALIRYDEFPFEYARTKIFLDERREKMQKAIRRVHLRHGSELFKQTFLDRFSGKTLREFDKEFPTFVSDYLNKRMPNDCSFGLQAYNFLKNLNKFEIDWQSLDEVRYGDVSDKKSDFQTLLEEYKKYAREHIMELEKYQQRFDNLNKDIK